LKAWIIVVGVITLAAGLLLIGISTASRNREIFISAEEDNPWEVTAYFEKGDRLRVYYTPPGNWRIPPYLTKDDIPEVGMPTKIVGINISHPIGGSTLITDVLAPKRLNVPLGEAELVKVLVFIEGRQNESLNVNVYLSRKLPGTDIVRYYLEETGGVVKYDGYYTARLSGPIPMSPTEEPEPPISLYLIREITVYPYTHLLLPGAFVVLFGIVVIAWGLVAKPSKIKRKGKI
jgi:hypothetical protein